jgi:glycosyltransferase involved in cell wall biosynthesis
MIAFLLQDTGSVYGAERATMDLARGLAGRGTKVVVVLIRETRLGLKESALEQAIRGLGLDVEIVTTRRRLSLKLAREIRGILHRRGVRVLHTVGYKADVHGVFAAAGIPHVSTVHGWLFRPDRKERFYGWVNVWALRRCARVIVLSRYYEDLLGKMGLRVERIPSGLDAGAFSADLSHRGTFTVGMMGRFSEEKNHGMLLRAVKKLVEDGVTVDVLIAGDGPLRPQIEAEVARLDLRHVVKLKGYVAREDFLGCVDMLVLCSRIENLPYSVMEAMACGLPVVATNVGGLPDLVEEGRTGFLVPPDDDVAMAERIARIAKSPQLAGDFGVAAREKIARDFSLERMVARHLDLYASLA